MRLQRFLALAGVDSRRRCEDIITAGRVRVNGEVARELGAKVDPACDTVELDGKQVIIEEKVYVLLNKPRGYLSTVIDARGRPTVSDLVKDLPFRVFPVGRLDMDTQGVILLTNDGALCHTLTHPRFGVEKVYRAEVAGKPAHYALEQLAKGVDIGGVITSPAKVKLINAGHDRSILEITVHEGRKRQIKRMCKAVGHPVITLDRIEFAGLRAGDLRPGQYRLLSDAEVDTLKRSVSPECGR
ncbi:MAG: pseudouridine synthase [Candidatus Abyssubacteria bacterium]